MCDLYFFTDVLMTPQPPVGDVPRTRWWKRPDSFFFAPRAQRDLEGRPASYVEQEESMTDFGNVPKEIELGNQENVVVVFDPRANSDLKDVTGQMGGTVYTFNVTLNGRPAIIKGGKRLLNAIQGAVGPVDPPTKIEIKAVGEPRSLERKYSARKVK